MLLAGTHTMQSERFYAVLKGHGAPCIGAAEGPVCCCTGTHTMQSERFYAALKGHGAPCRMVLLPHESHGYTARESVMHMLAEMNAWLERYCSPATSSISSNGASTHQQNGASGASAIAAASASMPSGVQSKL